MMDLLIEAHIGLERQGPGSPDTVAKALGFLGPLGELKNTADLGCGTGGQTFLLAEHLEGKITGLDLFREFTDELNSKAEILGLEDKVSAVTGRMEDLPFEKESFDLIWSEGAIDNIGFAAGLEHWRGFLRDGGYVAVSCPSWLTKEHPEEVGQFWEEAGSPLDTVENNIKAMQECGYAYVASFALSEECWTENYFYPRAIEIDRLLAKYDDSETMKQYAALNQKEVALYLEYGQHYGYVFYIGKKI